MISLIVCSVKPDQLARFEANVAETIGAVYEVIAIDNRQSAKGICQVYNEGFLQAKFETVCFCHEDILFKTAGWGHLLYELFSKNPTIGLVGVTGSVYKSSFPGPWVSVPHKFYRSNIMQQNNDGSISYIPRLDAGDYSEVAVLDGCFIVGPKHIFDSFPWNETLLKGFHLYDMDICLRVGQQYQIVVANHISLVHLSLGTLDSSWLQASEAFHRHYKSLLPVKKLVSASDASEINHYALCSYIYRLIAFKEPRLKIASLIAKLLIEFPFRKNNLSVIKKFARY